MMVRTTLVFIILIGFGCQSAKDEGDRFEHIEAEDSEKMVQVLEELNAQAYENPTEVFYLNSRIADTYLEMMNEAAPEDRPVVQFNYAWQLLQAGRTEEAIEQAEDLIGQLRAAPERMNDQTKPLFDLLGLAYLRLGEEQNCLHNSTATSCILPIRDDGVHQHRSGSERAAEIYFEMQRHFPYDLESRWLLNVAHMTLGEYPGGVHERFQIHGITAEDDETRFEDRAMDLGIAHEGLAGGVSVEDFTGNGWLDIMVTSWGVDNQMRFYENDGAGGFIDRTEEAGLNGLLGGLNIIHADYNNSGHTDVLVLRGAWLGDAGEYPNSLLRNNGDGTFTDVTYEAGLASYHPTQTAAWADINGNGYLDLFIGNESGRPHDAFIAERETSDNERPPRPSELYLNNGDGTFSEVSNELGLDIEAYVKGATFCDVNNSSWPDLYVSVLGGENLLFINEDGGENSRRFVERAHEAGVSEPIDSFTTWCWDMDNDGHEDLFVSGYDMRMLQQTARDIAAEQMQGPTRGEKPRVYRNIGNGTFLDVAGRTNLDLVMYTMGANFGDLTGNGYPDFYVGTGAPDLKSLIPNRAFTNRDGSYFEEVTFASGLGHIQKGHGAAINDFTHNGQREIYMVMGGAVEGDVAHNTMFEQPPGNTRWLNVRLKGNSSNRSAIGARIQVDITTESGEQRSIYRTVSTGGSFGAQSVRQDIGLANATAIDRLTITWPGNDNTPQTFTDIELDQNILLRQNDSEPTYLETTHVPFASADSLAHHR